MISMDLALSLKDSGLYWEPKLHDFFAIPDTSLSNRIFVVSDMMIDVQQLFGKQMITFNGAVEWSLDYITIAEAVWLPTEAQLRKAILHRLEKLEEGSVALESTKALCTCRMTFAGNTLAFESGSASDAYALSLLQILKLQAT